jgi:putative phosphoesterase
LKVLVISDIHGNIDGLKAIWEAEKDSDLILCIGDMVDIGAFGNEVVQWMTEHTAFVVRGNHDDKFNDYARRVSSGEVELKTSSPISLAFSKMDENQIKFIKNSPQYMKMYIDGYWYGIQHKYRRYKVIADKKTYVDFSLDHHGQIVDRMIFGHTHHQLVNKIDDYLILNPGSASYNRGPFLDSHNAFYMIIEDGEIIPKQISYNIDDAFSKVKSLDGILSGRYIRRIKKYYGL